MVCLCAPFFHFYSYIEVELETHATHAYTDGAVFIAAVDVCVSLLLYYVGF